jgi:hypothetical protein
VILMLSCAHPTIRRWHQQIGPPLNRHLGRLLTPKDYARAAETLQLGVPVAADNRAFAGFDAAGFDRMLTALQGLPVVWAAAPDVVGDAAATDRQYAQWAPRIHQAGLPVAYVAQDGYDRRGLPVHVGRVNTPGRMAYIHTLGATSFDGTQWARWSATHLHNGLRAAAAPPQLRLGLAIYHQS